MTISAALNYALSGLNAASRSAQVVSSNISNALTDGYARREIDLATARSGGVRVDGVARRIDTAVLSERRTADAAAGFAQAHSSGFAKLASALGEVGSPAGLSGRVARLENLFLEAASRPDSTTRLESLATGARDLARHLNAAQDIVQNVRLQADRAIADDVSRLETGLNRIHALNADILSATHRGADLNALKDMRQVEIDALASIVPLRTLPRGDGVVSLMTTTGQMLLEGRPAVIEFTASNAMSPNAILGSPLSGLTIDGRPVDMTRDGGRMAGGTLQAAFDLRDRIAPQFQSELDGIARDLIERTEGVDPTRSPGNPGLFTDQGAALGGAPPPGLAGRISLNALVDPDQGGDTWRLRSGLGSAGPGAPGDATLLQSLRTALIDIRVASHPDLGGGPRSFAGHADFLMSTIGGRQMHADTEAGFATAHLTELRRQESEGGVDTDAELQNLLLIERIYGANTKVLQAADAMLQRLMEI